MMKGKEATETETRTLDKYFILLTEHDLNASTFAARITASTLSDIYSAVVSAIGALKGDLHGSANSRTMESLIAIGDVKNVETFVDEALNNKKKLMGFGHRVYKGPDPRADDLRAMAKALAVANPEQSKWFAISEKLEQMVWARKKLNCNVDFYSASVLYTLGIPVDLFTTMFAISRVAGWTAHILEQYADNRLIRPLSSYTGEANRAYTPIQKRK
jgi:citrate synthase